MGEGKGQEDTPRQAKQILMRGPSVGVYIPPSTLKPWPSDPAHCRHKCNVERPRPCDDAPREIGNPKLAARTRGRSRRPLGSSMTLRGMRPRERVGDPR